MNAEAITSLWKLAWLKEFWKSTRGRRAEFAALFDKLQQERAELDHAAARLESQFLKLGSELEGFATHGRQFVQQAQTLARMATGKACDNSAFTNSVALIEKSTQFLVSVRDEILSLLATLRSHNTQIEQLLALDSELRRTMMPLKFVQTMFKAESAPLGPGVQQTFAALTEEIGKLNVQVQDIFGEKFAQLVQIGAVVRAAINRLDRQAQALEETVTTQKEQIESSLEFLKQEMSTNQKRDEGLALSADFARELEQVVMGIQFQDIITQKIQHVRAAIPNIESRLATVQEASAEAETVEALQFLHQSCSLEAEQIKTAGEELARAEATIRAGLEQLLGHLKAIETRCLSLDEFKTVTTSYDGIVQSLVETIGGVRNLVSASFASVAEVYEMLRPLQGLASDLTAIVREVSSQAHLIALNAQIQAAAATAENARAAGLEVLAARMNWISDETGRISQLAARRLDEVAKGLAASVSTFERLQVDGVAQQSTLNDSGRKQERELHSFRDKALRALRALGDSLDQLPVKAHRALDCVEFAEFHQDRLPAFRAPLVEIADLAEQRLASSGHPLPTENLVGATKRGYTMASELKVFESIVPKNNSGQGQGQASENPEPNEAGQEVASTDQPTPAAANGLGDNVELF